MAYLRDTGKEEEDDKVVEVVSKEAVIAPPLVPEEEEEYEEGELTDEELDEAEAQGAATAKAMSAPPKNKAVAGKQTK